MRRLLARLGLLILAGYARVELGAAGPALVFDRPFRRPDGRRVPIRPTSPAALRITARGAQLRRLAPADAGPTFARPRFGLPARLHLGAPPAQLAYALRITIRSVVLVAAAAICGTLLGHLPISQALSVIRAFASLAALGVVGLMALLGLLPVAAMVLTAVLSRPTAAAQTSATRDPAPMVTAALAADRAILRTLARVLPHAGSAFARLAAGAALVALAAFAWLTRGHPGIRVVFGRLNIVPATRLDRWMVSSSIALRRRVASRSHAAPMPGVFRDPARWVRTPGKRSELRPWQPRVASAEALTDFANAVLLAVDTALTAGRPDRAEHTIKIVRAWADPAFLALVVQITPPRLAARAVNLREQVMPMLDATSRWTQTYLRTALNLSDERLSVDPRADGLPGLYITLSLPRAPEPETPKADPDAGIADPILRAIRAGVRKQADPEGRPLPADFFRLAPTGRDNPSRIYDPGKDVELVRYRLSSGHHTPGPEAFQASARVFAALEGSIRFAAADLRGELGQLWTDWKEHQFVVDIKLTPTPFPNGELRRFVAAHAEHYQKNPYAVAVGFDRRGEPLWWDLAGGGQPPNSLVVGETGSGKTVSGPVSVALQLSISNSPEAFQLVLLDSPKREGLRYLDALPHVGVAEIAEDGPTAVAWFERVMALVKERQREYAGDDWTPRRGPLVLAICEEWLVLAESMSKADRDKAESLIVQIANVARSVGVRLMIVSQKGTDDCLSTRATAALKVRISGRARSADYQQMLEVSDVPIPDATPGRLAVSGLVPGRRYAIVQGLNTSKPTADAIARELSARWPAARTQRPPASSGPQGDPPPPAAGRISDDGTDWPDRRLITQARVSDIDRDPLTIVRVVWDWRHDVDEPLISMSTVRDRVRALGLTTPRESKIDAAIATLKRPDVGLLVPAADRRFLVPAPCGWTVARARLAHLGLTDEESGHDR
jgi:hypothetical protein